MSIFAWDKKYSVKIEYIDQQHKKLFKIINELFESFSSGCDKNAMKKTLMELASYTKEHFTLEEEMLKKAKYPKLSNHHQIHVKLINEINQYIMAYNKNDMQTMLQMPQFLRSWLCEHILKVDTEYSEHVLNSQQISGVI